MWSLYLYLLYKEHLLFVCCYVCGVVENIVVVEFVGLMMTIIFIQF